jgi:CBS domain containing-hemolysin-like protein
MAVLTLWVAALLAGLSTLAAILAAALERDELINSRNEALIFFRLALTGLFGVMVDQSLTPLGWSWWSTALTSLGLMSALLIASQLLSKAWATSKFSSWLVASTSTIISSIDLLFTPLALPKENQPDEFEQELLESVDEFGETIVREVMVPRVDMATIPASASLEKAMSVFLETGYSRLPVVQKNVDDVIGVLYLKDLIRVLNGNSSSMKKTTCESKARPAIFVPESKPADDLLREMQSSATHIAIVVDEYGGVAGLVTMEDVIEEIVGDISDEYDRDDVEVQLLPDGKMLVSAKMSLFDLGERLGLELEDDDVDTVGGMLSKELDRLPTKGDRIVISGLVLIAERFEGRPKRLKTVLVEPTKSLIEAQSAFDEMEK